MNATTCTTTVVCQDPGDGSDDVIIELPAAILAAMNVGIGETLSLEIVEGSVVLKPVRNSDSKR